jgi:hypothetical protein
MPLKKLQLKAGVNRENTRYTNENGWYDCDKVRFRQGTPEKIGGWYRISSGTFLGVCRSLWKWVTLGGQKLLGVGTNLKFYINSNNSSTYYDVTPLRKTAALLGNNPFTGSGTTTVTVTDSTGGYIVGDFVTFSGATTVGGVDLNGEYQIQTISGTTYTITAASPVTGTGGGATVLAAYQLNVGPATQEPITGWGTGSWGAGGWGTGTASNTALRVWSQANFGQNLIFGPRGGAIYVWDAALGVTTRATNITAQAGSDGYAPNVQNYIIVTDASRFVMAFGCDDYSTAFPTTWVQDPMLIRWSDQESLVDWFPSATNQAGSIRLSRGSEIVTALQSRQEILVWTDSSLYSMQYLGSDPWWGSQILGDNISIIGENAAAIASGVTYWMGSDKFYLYDGTVKTLKCDLREFIYNNINAAQSQQVCAGTNEGFNEVWWFYCTADSTVVNRYVVYNYLENIWYYGSMGRTAWLDSGLSQYPLAATYNYNIVEHENGVDDNTTSTTLPIESYIASSEFDIDDGYQVGFVWRMLPDIKFTGSQVQDPSVVMYLYPMQNSGGGINSPTSVGGISEQTVAQINPPSTAPGAAYTVEKFTGQINTRVRGRQLIMQVRSTGIGVQWQLGSPRIDIRADGRR